MKGIFILIWNITKFTPVAIFPRGNKILTILSVGWTVFNTVACFSWYILMVSHSLSWFELSHGWLAIYSFCRCSWPGHNTISLYCTGIKPETVSVEVFPPPGHTGVWCSGNTPSSALCNEESCGSIPSKSNSFYENSNSQDFMLRKQCLYLACTAIHVPKFR